ncbi:MAG: enoyl-CoA hydratase/isomerase family protein [Alphaproteobacteria bacterium]|nr:enoyl-CoA hydratase/isomerase family protein [Alphaproteobacteria bacterium]
MTDAQVRLHLDKRAQGSVVTLEIDNSSRLNSLNTKLMEAFVAAANAVTRMDDVRAVIITGAGGKAFVGGADISEMGDLRDEVSAREFIGRVHQCCHAVRAIPVPTIAKINGYVFGAGLELAAACDLRACSDTSVFGMPEVRLGIPSVVEAALLPMLVGWGRTRWMLMLGDTFDASQAQSWGLVETVVAPGMLDQAVNQWVESLFKCAPRAVMLQKQLIRSWEDLPLRAAIATGIDTFGSAYATTEPRDAMQRFLESNAQRKREARSAAKEGG